jgi:hypothetical protein
MLVPILSISRKAWRSTGQIVRRSQGSESGTLFFRADPDVANRLDTFGVTNEDQPYLRGRTRHQTPQQLSCTSLPVNRLANLIPYRRPILLPLSGGFLAVALVSSELLITEPLASPTSAAMVTPAKPRSLAMLAKLWRRIICAGRLKRLSGVIAMARNGGAFHRSSAHGGWRRRHSSAVT